MLADSETDTVLIADTLPERHPEIVRRLEEILRTHGIPLEVVPNTADIWIRDAAPVQVGPDAFVQFTYRPDYLRDGYENRITGPEVFAQLPWVRGLEGSGLVIDGGNVVGVPGTAILTDKVYRENPTWDRDELRKELRRLLGVERLIIVPKEPYDAIGHSDGMVRFIDASTVVANDYSTVDPEFGERFHGGLRANGLTVVLIPYRPENNPNNGIDSAVGNYANFLRVQHLVFMPAYGLAEDTIAVETLQHLCPEATVVSIDCVGLAREGGVLQCVTWTVRRAARHG
jgi:agmatine deiminase